MRQQYEKSFHDTDLLSLRSELSLCDARLTDLLSRVDIGDHGLWAEIGEQIEQRRKLAESESKQQIASQQLLRVDQALLMMHNMIDIVTRHILEIGPSHTPKQALSAIIVDMQQMAGHAVPTYTEAEREE